MQTSTLVVLDNGNENVEKAPLGPCCLAAFTMLM
jgi:hypothetical protein